MEGCQPDTCLLHHNPSHVLSVNLQCACGDLLQAKIRVVGFMHHLCPLDAHCFLKFTAMLLLVPCAPALLISVCLLFRFSSVCLVLIKT